MFLQSWPLGCWGVTVGAYIAANTGDAGARLFSAGFIGYSTIAAAAGSLVSPYIAGVVSDRLVSPRMLLGALNLGCGAAAIGLYYAGSEMAFFLWLAAYFQFYFPIITVSNTIGLAHLVEPDAEFPVLRLYGALGWIAAGVFVGFVWPVAVGHSIEATGVPFLIGAAANVTMFAYALTLPSTMTTTPSDSTQPLTSGARALLSNWPLRWFLVASFFACVPSMAYNNFCNPFMNSTGFPRPAAMMTIGQVSEIAVLAAMPWLTRRVRLPTLYTVGLVAWVARYGLLAMGAELDAAWPVGLAILLHGPCFAFVYVIGPMLADRFTPAANRGAAQGIYAVASTGLGHVAGAIAVGLGQAAFLTPTGVSPPPYDWTTFWISAAAVSATSLVAVACLLRFAYDRST